MLETILKQQHHSYYLLACMCAKSLQSCPTLTARLLCLWDSPDKNIGGGCHFLLQGIFPTQGLNPCLLHCRYTLALQVDSSLTEL